METEVQPRSLERNDYTHTGQNLAASEAIADPGRWSAMLVLLLAAFMDLLDASIVNIAIPSIQRTIGATYASIQWTVAGYTLAYALTLITGGRLGDIFGRKRIFMIGIAGFTLASLLSGVAASPEMLVAARLLQGAMGGLMIPQVLSIAQVIFPPKERAAAFGMYGAVAGLSTVAGPIIGALLVEGNIFGLEWRPIFLINLPVGIAALIASGLIVRESRAPHALKLDLPGVGIITVALLMLLYPLVQGRDLGWPVWAFVSMVASLPVFALFALYERYKTRRDGSPLVELGLFRQGAFVAGLLTGLIFFVGISSFFFIYTLFLQIGLGWSALQAGLTGVPWSLGAVVGSGLSANLAPKVGRRIISIGAVLMVVGIVALLFTINIVGADVTPWHLIPSMLVAGIGMGLIIVPMVDIVLAGVEGKDAGSASGVLNTTNQLGGAIGIAVIGVLFFGLLGNQANASVDSVAPQIRSGLQAAGLPAPAQDQIVQGFRTCFYDRTTEKDPFEVPASCQALQTPPAGSNIPAQTGQQIGNILATAGTDALKQDFVSSMGQVLWFEAAVYAMTFFLVFLLPRRARHYDE